MPVDDLVVRLGSGTAGDISFGAITSLSNSRVVAAMRNGSGALQLIVWEIDGNGNLTRGGSGTAGDISLVAITSLSNSRVVAAMRNGSGDLQLIVWDIDGNGNLTRRGSGTAGDISLVAITSLGNSRVVAAMRNGSGDLQLIVWDIDGNGNLTRRGSGTAGDISLVAITSLGNSRVVAAMRNGSGDLQLIVWDIDGNGNLTRGGSGTAGDISLVAITSLSNSRVVAAMRNGSGDLQLIVWDIDGNGDLTRVGSGTAGDISQVAIVARDRSRVVAAMRNGSGDLQLIVWEIDGNGNLTRRGSGTAGDISLVEITSLGNSRVVAAMRNGSGDLQLIVWGRITDNFTFDNAFAAAQIAILIDRHQLAFNQIQACTTLDDSEKEVLTTAYESPIEHGINTNPNANASAFVNGSQIFVNLTNFFALINDERAQTLIHEMMHCAGFDHPTRIDPPNPNPDRPGDNGPYYGSPPLQAEICIAGTQSDRTCVQDATTRTLQVQRVGSVPEIDVDRTDIDFAAVPIGSFAEEFITIANTGNAPLSVAPITRSGSTRFRVMSPTEGAFTVAAGGTRLVTVRFTPNATSLQTGMLTISSNDSDEPSLSVSLRGSGEPDQQSRGGA